MQSQPTTCWQPECGPGWSRVRSNVLLGGIVSIFTEPGVEMRHEIRHPRPFGGLKAAEMIPNLFDGVGMLPVRDHARDFVNCVHELADHLKRRRSFERTR